MGQAHTTQFTERGWIYLGGSGSALLPDAVKSLGKTGGSYVSLVSPGCKTDGGGGIGCELSIIIETVGASGPTPIEFKLLSSLASVAKLSCWTTSHSAGLGSGTGTRARPQALGPGRVDLAMSLEP